jgi:hypothetical protein
MSFSCQQPTYSTCQPRLQLELLERRDEGEPIANLNNLMQKQASRREIPKLDASWDMIK